MTGDVLLTSLNIASSAMNTTIDVADYFSDLLLQSHQEPSEEEEEVPEPTPEVAPSASNQIPIRRNRSRSRDVNPR